MNARGDTSGHGWGERRAGFTRVGTSADERLLGKQGDANAASAKKNGENLDWRVGWQHNVGKGVT